MEDTRRPRLRLDSFQLARTMMRLRGRSASIASVVTDEEEPQGDEHAQRHDDSTLPELPPAA
jgi:hypothetical protein